MKIHHKNKSKSTLTTSCGFTAKPPYPESDIEIVAEELTEMAKLRLPNHVMRGILQGYEEDIRQEAVLLALKWHFQHRAAGQDPHSGGWNSAQAICAALRYRKLDHIEKNRKERQIRSAWAESQIQQQHEANSGGDEAWSPSEIRQALAESIQTALKRGDISHANAGIAMQVYVDGIAATDLAAKLNVSRSAIHQHLNRVKKAIPRIIPRNIH